LALKASVTAALKAIEFDAPFEFMPMRIDPSTALRVELAAARPYRGQSHSPSVGRQWHAFEPPAGQG
jgi:hypothetical protein